MADVRLRPADRIDERTGSVFADWTVLRIYCTSCYKVFSMEYPNNQEDECYRELNRLFELHLNGGCK